MRFNLHLSIIDFFNHHFDLMLTNCHNLLSLKHFPYNWHCDVILTLPSLKPKRNQLFLLIQSILKKLRQLLNFSLFFFLWSLFIDWTSLGQALFGHCKKLDPIFRRTHVDFIITLETTSLAEEAQELKPGDVWSFKIDEDTVEQILKAFIISV